MSPVEKPTQADREAAAAYFDTVGDHLRAEITRRGEYDLSAAVKAFARHRLAADQAARTTTDAAIAKALEPVMHWYQSDEHEPRPLHEIVADVVADLQQDRATVLQAARTTTTEGDGFKPMETWDCRDEAVLLLVDYREGEHPLEDALFAITIGHNNDHNVGESEGQGWRFAGWCWSHDHYVEGKGQPVGWMPLPHILARAYAAFEGEPILATPPATPAGGGEALAAKLKEAAWLWRTGGALTVKGLGIEPADLEAAAAALYPSPVAAPAREAGA